MTDVTVTMSKSHHNKSFNYGLQSYDKNNVNSLQQSSAMNIKINSGYINATMYSKVYINLE